jgi:Bacterial Ig-like domain
LNRKVLAALGLLAVAALAAAQAPDRIATTAEALVANPLFFHGKRIVVRHPVKQTGALFELEATSKPVFVYWKDSPVGSDGEIRGEFYDLGRMQEGDSRFSSIDFTPIVEAVNKGRWPGRDQIFVILGATFVEGPLPPAPTIRAIALAPDAYEGREVTLTGRFKGHNLYGDVPQGVAKSKWDFILQSADAAVWVTGVRPKGKDFDLDPGARVDTGKWIEVKGTVQRDGTMVWIAGKDVRLATAPAEVPIEIVRPSLPTEPPPSVIFSAPLAGETDFPAAGKVRIQFSRDMNPSTFRDRVRIHYAGPKAPAIAPPNFTLTYNDANRSVEIKFKEPLASYQMVEIQLTEGITAIDGQALPPWTLRFTTGQ